MLGPNQGWACFRFILLHFMSGNNISCISNSINLFVHYDLSSTSFQIHSVELCLSLAARTMPNATFKDLFPESNLVDIIKK